MRGALDGCVRLGFYRAGLALLFVALFVAVTNIVLDPDWATRTRDAAHWLLLYAAAAIAIAIYHIHITRFQLETASAAPDVVAGLRVQCRHDRGPPRRYPIALHPMDILHETAADLYAH